MPVTQKVSVALGQTELRLAKTAAERDRVSLSAFVTEMLRRGLEERDRLDAARELLATFTTRERATVEEREELMKFWSEAMPGINRKPPRHKRKCRGA